MRVPRRTRAEVLALLVVQEERRSASKGALSRDILRSLTITTRLLEELHRIEMAERRARPVTLADVPGLREFAQALTKPEPRHQRSEE